MFDIHIFLAILSIKGQREKKKEKERRKEKLMGSKTIP
jgi:hypothetical protein